MEQPLEPDEELAKDSVTVLRAVGKRLCKVWTQVNGKVEIQNFDRAYEYSRKVIEVDDFDELAEMLEKLRAKADMCLVYGQPKAGLADTTRRTKEHFDDVPRHYLRIDVDGYTPVMQSAYRDGKEGLEASLDEYVQTQLPTEFHNASYHWHLTGSACKPSDPDTLRAHLTFWTTIPHTPTQLEDWAVALKEDAIAKARARGDKTVNKGPVDPAPLRVVQVNYTADPLFDGVQDPIATLGLERSGVRRGKTDEVALVLRKRKGLRVIEGGKALDAVRTDPRTRSNVVGAFCTWAHERGGLTWLIEEYLSEAFEPEDGWDNGFAETSGKVRLNYLDGGGSPGGAVIFADNLWLANTHASSVSNNHAVNAWDLMRLYWAGGDGAPWREADAKAADEIDPDWAWGETQPYKVPSYQLMRQWVNTLEGMPELIENVQAAKVQAKAEVAVEAVVNSPVPDVLAKRLEAAADRAAVLDVCRDIATATLPALDKNLIEVLLQRALFRVDGVKPTMAAVRETLRDVRVTLHGDSSTTTSDRPEWVQGWWWSYADKKYFHQDSKLLLDKENFDMTYNRELSEDAGNSASYAATRYYDVQTVAGTLYAPHLGSAFYLSGTRFLNTYQTNTVPEDIPLSKLTDEQKEVVRGLDKHIEWMFPRKEEHIFLKQWFAHNVQRPGIKIRWSPWIIGLQGDGKTSLVKLVGLAMGGAPHFHEISAANATEKFNDFATKGALCLVNEAMLQGKGHNKMDLPDAMKSLIADDSVSVRAMNKSAVDFMNCQNYVFLTNHAAALSLEDSDRRYFVLKTCFKNLDDLRMRCHGIDPAKFIGGLLDKVKKHPEAIRAYFMNISLDGFDPNGRAPTTKFRDVVAAASKSPAQVSLEAAIEEGAVGVSDKVIAGLYLDAALTAAGSPGLQGWEKNKALGALGWYPLPGRIMWKGKRQTVYVKDIDEMMARETQWRNDIARMWLDETLEKGFPE